MFNEPEGGNGGSLTLTVEDASCTEAWIKLNETNAELPASVKLYANDTLKQTLELTTADTLIYDEGLLPNRAYAYQAELIKPQKPTLKSQTVTATTMDTTSHDFTWETFTFGGANGSSYLRDVAIINENDIWAVGEIHTSWTDQWDSNGVWVQPYNAVHWNGQEWELKRIYFPTVCGQQHLTPYPASAIFAFDDGQIWISSSGDKIAVIEDNVQINKFCLPSSVSMSINAMWGTSSSDFYVVGNNGNIAHYDGNGWEKIESGTGSAIQEVWGVNNIITGKQELYFSVPTQYSVYKMDEQNNIKRLEIGNNKYFRGMWTKNGLKVYVSGFGIVSGVSGQWTVELEGSQLFFKDVKGDGNNNIVAAGANGEVAVFNGIRWFRYNEITANNILYDKVSVKYNTVVAVGETFGNEISGIILIGHRN